MSDYVTISGCLFLTYRTILLNSKIGPVSKQVRRVHHSWVNGTLGYKYGTKNDRKVVKVLLERYSNKNSMSINQKVKFGSK